MAETTSVQAQPQRQSQLAVLKATLNADSVQEQFRNALAENKDLFVASIIDLYTSDKALQTCAPAAIVSEALKAAVLDLPINKALGFAYIVVYNNSVKRPNGTWVKEPTPTFIVGYKGYMQLAARSGQYRTINADVVREGELVENDMLSGTIKLDRSKRKSDKVIGYFAYIEYLNGFSKVEYMSVEDMAKYALRFSPSIKRGTTLDQLIALANTESQGKTVGWLGNFNDMAKKTMLRQLIGKYGIMSIKMQSMQTALASDVNADALVQRDAMLDTAEAQTIAVNADTVEFEEIVDETTGEVQTQPVADAANTEAEAPY